MFRPTLSKSDDLRDSLRELSGTLRELSGALPQPQQNNLKTSIEDCFFFAIPVGVLMNMLIIWLKFPEVPRVIHNDLCVEVLAAFLVSFACIAQFRATLRLSFGRGSPQSQDIDRSLLQLFGVHLSRRGASGAWVYPVLSTAPAFLLMAVTRWYRQDEFVVLCKTTNDKFELSTEYCHLSDAKQAWSQMFPFVLSQLVFVYGLVKAVGQFMVLLDPKCEGTLSELRMWEKKSISQSDVQGRAPRRQDTPRGRRPRMSSV